MNGIQNDKWIISKCARPGYVLTERRFEVGNPPTSLTLRTTDVQVLSTMSEPEIQELMEARRQIADSSEVLSLDDCAGVVDYRPATEADLAGWRPMIEPFFGHQVRTESRLKPMYLPTLDDDAYPERFEDQRVISYGVSSFGYDVRIADEFKIFTNINSTRVDPKNFDDRSFVDFKGDVCVIPPNSFVLARSVEYFRMPRNVSGLVLGKSTYARCGINCIATPLEPGWEGHITLEYINGTPLPALLYANEGAAQVQFFEGEQPLVSYADRGGKYQGQQGITLPKA